MHTLIILGYLIVVVIIIIFMYGMVWCSLSIFSAYFYLNGKKKEKRLYEEEKNDKIQDSFCLEFVNECLCLRLFWFYLA